MLNQVKRMNVTIITREVLRVTGSARENEL